MPRCICQSDVKREYRLGNKPIPNRVGRNCFHYSLIDTSKRIFTEDAISIEAILHAEHKGKLCTGPKKEKMVLKIFWTFCRTSALLSAFVYDPLRGSSNDYT